MFSTSPQSAQRIKRAVQFTETYAGQIPTFNRPGAVEVLYAQITSTTLTSGRYPASRYEADAQLTTWTDTGDTCWLVPPNGEALSTGTIYAVNLREVLDSDGLAVYTVVSTPSTPVVKTVYIYTDSLPSYTKSGSVLTASSNGALSAQDGYTLAVNDLFLYSPESGTGLAADGGIYSLTALGSAGTPWTATLNSSSVTGDLVYVIYGTKWFKSLWIQQQDSDSTSWRIWHKLGWESSATYTFTGDVTEFDSLQSTLIYCQPNGANRIVKGMKNGNFMRTKLGVRVTFFNSDTAKTIQFNNQDAAPSATYRFFFDNAKTTLTIGAYQSATFICHTNFWILESHTGTLA